MQPSLKKRVGSFVLTLIFALSLPGTAFASAGDLDPNFGIGGKVTTSFPIAGWVTTSLQGSYDRANAAVLQPDGKMIVVGDAKQSSYAVSFMGLARYNADGSLDTTFGANGKVSDNNLGFYGAVGSAVVLLPDGRIVVAGYVNVYNNGDPTSNAVIALFTSSGSLDTSFNTTGYRIFDYGGNEKATSIIVQSDGKIVAGIYSTNYSANNFILVRCNTDGTLDASFGTGGVVTTDLGAAYTEGINALATQTISGVEKIIAVGSSPSHSGDFAVLRYNVTNGALDATFGASGKTVIDFGHADSGRAVAIQSDGKIVVAGSASNGVDNDFALARFTADGALDSAFSAGGQVVTDFATGDETASAVLIQSDGKILVSGSTNGGIGLVRFTDSGALDTDFGTGGKSTPVLPFPHVIANSMLVQTGGRIVVVGSAGETFSLNFFLVGLNHDGSLDNTFGLDFAYTSAEAHAIALQSDGKIVLAGSSVSDYSQKTNFALARYNTDGSLDTSFGAKGRLTIVFGNETEEANAAAVQPDGKIVVAGDTGDDSTFSQLAMARYNADGSPDTSFGTNGLVKYGVDEAFIVITDLLLQSDGKIILAGSASNDSGGNSFMLARYTTNGILDTTFGDNGITLTSFSNPTASIRSIALQPDGKIVAAGFTVDKTSNLLQLALARFTTNGALDTDFGVSGLASNATIQSATAVSLQPDGKIVVAGTVYASPDSDFGLARYNTDGTLDTSFGIDGMVRTDFNGASNDALNSIIVQTDGRIVAAGYTYSSSSQNEDFAIARYNSNGSLDTSFNSSGKLSIDFNVSEREEATKVAFQQDGSLILAGQTMYTSNNVQLQDFALARVKNELRPLATTNAATSVKSDSAVLNGMINAYYHDATVTFEYGTNTSYGTTVSAVPATISGAVKTSVTYPLTGLKYNTTYHYRVVATNSIGTTYGSDQTFTPHFTTQFATYLPIVLR
jgi:uncharacterized delta-60 repeat protein